MKRLPRFVGEVSAFDVDLNSLPPAPPPSPIEAVSHWRRSPLARFARLRARLFPTTSTQPADLIELAGWNGFEELSGPVAGVLRCLSVRSPEKLTRRAVRIPVGRVLSWVWRPVRVAHNCELSAKGTKPPPVTLAEVRFWGERFFLVRDGHHRSEVCKMRRVEHQLGVVGEVFVLDPTQWTIVPGGVRSRDGSVLKLAADEVAAARWLGVP